MGRPRRCYNRRMRRPSLHCLPRSLALLVLVLLSAAPSVARAELVDDIYTALLPVDTRGSAELDRARRAGLAQVLIKASGDLQAPEHSETAAALERAERYLISYSYEETADGEAYLRLNYDERAVQALVQSAGLPLWTANRPPTVAWVVLSDQGRRVFLSPAERPGESAVLQASFRDRGLPLQLPLFDLADTAALSPGEAWRQSSASILEASRRYRGAEILAGRAARTATGRWVGDWRLLYEGRWLSRPVDADAFEAFTAAGADLVAATIAGRYGVRQSAAGDQRHRITLRGIRGFGAYRAAEAALAGLETVSRVVPERLLGDQVSLRIEADADVIQLARIIELDRRFVPTPAGPGEAGLFYEWIP